MNIPINYVECPVCNGTGKVELSEKEKQYWWNEGKSEKECQNCGGAEMSNKGRGYVNINFKTGKGCIHEYKGTLIGRCLTEYVCKHCNHRYIIDSGD